MIIDHNHSAYRRKWQICGNAKYNGAFFYSQEIVKNIIPLIDTDRNWITVNVKGYGCDHAIVFVHNNLHPENYEWLSKYNDLVFVCGIPETMDKVKHLGKVIYVPISVNVEDVKRYKVKEKTNDTCYAGRRAKRRVLDIPNSVTMLEGMPREKLLAELATYRKAYAVGRTAIEAKILGCEILPVDPRFPDVDRWEIIDNKDAAKILQAELDKIDRPDAVTEQETEDDTPELDKMTKAQLIEYAEDNDIKIDKRAKKAGIIEMIQNG